MSDLQNNKVLVKSIASGAFAGVVDKMLQGNNGSNMTSGVFGASVGAGIMVTTLITAQIPDSYSSGMTSGVGKRALEIAGTSASTYVIHQKIMPMVVKSVRLPDVDLKSVGIIVAADLFGEMFYQWMSGGEASFFQ